MKYLIPIHIICILYGIFAIIFDILYSRNIGFTVFLIYMATVSLIKDLKDETR